MYGAIPDVVISKQPPRNNPFRVVVALGFGVLIGALGTAMLFPQSTKETESPTPAPRPILAASTLSPTNDDDVIPHNLALMARGPEAPSPSRAAMELKIEECSADAIKYYQDHTDIIAFEFCMKRCHSDACYSLMQKRGS